MAGVQNISLTAPTDYSAEQQSIERQRKLAELLQQQSMQPLDTNQMAGGYVLPVSPVAGLAKMLQAYNGAQGQRTADEKQKALSAQAQADALKWMSDRPQGKDINPVKMDDEGNVMPPAMVAPTRQDQEAWALRGMGNPISGSVAGSYLAQMLKGPESAFGKVDAKDYTPESIAKFAQTNNYADLVPVRKKEVVSLGGTSQVVDPYAATTGATMPHSISPDTQATLNQKDQQWQGLSAAQRLGFEMEAARLGISVQQLMMDRARLGNQSIETQFNTGSSAGVPALTMPQIPSIPAQGAPAAGNFVQPPAMRQPAPVQMPVSGQQRQVTPVSARPPVTGVPAQTNDGLTPAGRAAVAKESAISKAQMANKREFNMGGINDALDAAQAILEGKAGPAVKGIPTASPTPTNSLFGSLADSAASWFGAAPAGAAPADQLRAIGGALVAKMPRMEGPQSDKDVALYSKMAGQIGDDTIPIQRRLTALQTVRELFAKYENQNSRAGASGSWDGQDRRQGGRVVDFNSLPQGGAR